LRRRRRRSLHRSSARHQTRWSIRYVPTQKYKWRKRNYPMRSGALDVFG